MCSLPEQKEWPSPMCAWKTKTCFCPWLFLMLWYIHLMLIAQDESNSSGYLSSGSRTTSPTKNPLCPCTAVLFELKLTSKVGPWDQGSSLSFHSTRSQTWDAFPDSAVHNKQESDRDCSRIGKVIQTCSVTIKTLMY